MARQGQTLEAITKIGHQVNTYNDFTYNDFTYNDFTYNDFTYNDFTYKDFTYKDFTNNANTYSTRYR